MWILFSSGERSFIFLSSCHGFGRMENGEERTRRGAYDLCLYYISPESCECSHAHFDHSRPIADEFPHAHAYFGPGTDDECKTKLEPYNTDPAISHKYDPRIFDPEVSKEHWSELQGPWGPFGVFDHAMDVFGNGSFWIIQAPGHMPGNLCAAARVEGGEWVLLGSDCAHSR